MRKHVLDEQNAFAVVETAVREAQDQIKSWTGAPNKWRSMGRGLEEVYRRSGEAFVDASA